MKSVHNTFMFGGDWNPEQWDESTWEHDIEMLEDAHINEATVNVFSWALLQRDETHYDYAVLDRIVALLVRHDFNIVLATSTAALPAWLVRAHPETMLTGADGQRRVHGGRHNFCPNSTVFRTMSGRLAGALGQRYATTPGLRAWHIGNEYGGGGGMCYCDVCAAAFRLWLEAKYGSIEALNKAWCMNFWGHTLSVWEDVMPPVPHGDGIDTERCVISGLLMDYRRFQNESQLACFTNERDAIRAFDAETPITTNLMGTFKDLDYFAWGREMDVVSWDNYPGMQTPSSYTAMCHDLMRAVGGGKPFMLMEQTPNQQNWFPYCKVKQPGEVRALSWQAVAHGADTVQFFQLKQSLGGCERFHGAIIGHDGTERSRVFTQTAALGDELSRVGGALTGLTTHARVAVVFDWESYWSLEGCVGPTTGFSYPQEVHRFYRALHDRNITVDIIESTCGADALSRYDLVVAPALIMVKPGVAESMTAYVNSGGHLVTGYMSGIHDEHDLVIPGGYPGPLRALAGVWVEEIDALAPDEAIDVLPALRDSSVNLGADSGAGHGLGESGTAPALGRGEIVASIMRTEGASTLAVYGGNGFYAGTPAVTMHEVGAGAVYYVGTPLDERGMDSFFAPLIEQLGLTVVVTPPDIEVSQRRDAEGRIVSFVINTGDTVRRHIALPGLAGHTNLLTGVELKARDVEDFDLPPYGVVVAVTPQERG